MSFRFKLELKDYFDIYLLMSILIPTLFIFFIDIPNLRKDNLKKESKIAKVISIIYIVAGPMIYLFFKII